MNVFSTIIISGFLGLSSLGCSSMLYYPSKQMVFDPSKAKIKVDDITFESIDGTRLNGWYFKNARGVKPKAIIVTFHGNAENISSHSQSLLWLLNEAYDFFIFDYRGYGASEGVPTPEGTVMDGKAAILWAAKRSMNTPLVILGRSLGGAVAIRSVLDLKTEVPDVYSRIKFFVADSSFLSYRRAGAYVLSNHWLTWSFQWLSYLLLSDEYTGKDKVVQLSPTPILVIHGDADRVVDFDLGMEFFEKAAEPKEFWHIQGGRHTDIFYREKGRYRSDFLKKVERHLN